jgi:hypothetical protein
MGGLHRFAAVAGIDAAHLGQVRRRGQAFRDALSQTGRARRSFDQGSKP